MPYMDVSKEWTDKELFEFFGITKGEQQHLRKKYGNGHNKTCLEISAFLL